MSDFLEIKSLDRKTQRKMLEEIERRIEEKKRESAFTEREIREIEEMRLHPLPDIQDVQSVYDNHLFKKPEKKQKKIKPKTLFLEGESHGKEK